MLSKNVSLEDHCSLLFVELCGPCSQAPPRGHGVNKAAVSTDGTRGRKPPWKHSDALPQRPQETLPPSSQESLCDLDKSGHLAGPLSSIKLEIQKAEDLCTFLWKVPQRIPPRGLESPGYGHVILPSLGKPRMSTSPNEDGNSSKRGAMSLRPGRRIYSISVLG